MAEAFRSHSQLERNRAQQTGLSIGISPVAHGLPPLGGANSSWEDFSQLPEVEKVGACND